MTNCQQVLHRTKIVFQLHRCAHAWDLPDSIVRRVCIPLQKHFCEVVLSKYGVRVVLWIPNTVQPCKVHQLLKVPPFLQAQPGDVLRYVLSDKNCCGGKVLANKGKSLLQLDALSVQQLFVQSAAMVAWEGGTKNEQKTSMQRPISTQDNYIIL